jgi:thiol-disulfide isomerase/thioredoxin
MFFMGINCRLEVCRYLICLLVVPCSAGLLAGELPGVIVSDKDGRKDYLKSFAGHGIAIMNFWASYCQPCQKEIPELIKLSDQFPAARLVFVNLDAQRDQQLAREMAQRIGIQNLLFDRYQNTTRAFKTGGRLPFTVVSHNGKIIYERIGYNPEMIAALKELLKSHRRVESN